MIDWINFDLYEHFGIDPIPEWEDLARFVTGVISEHADGLISNLDFLKATGHVLAVSGMTAFPPPQQVQLDRWLAQHIDRLTFEEVSLASGTYFYKSMIIHKNLLPRIICSGDILEDSLRVFRDDESGHFLLGNDVAFLCYWAEARPEIFSESMRDLTRRLLQHVDGKMPLEPVTASELWSLVSQSDKFEALLPGVNLVNMVFYALSDPSKYIRIPNSILNSGQV